MKNTIRISCTVLGMLIPALLTTNAYAQCGAGRPVHTGLSKGLGHVQLLPVAFLPPWDQDRDRDDRDHGNSVIVGFWHQQIISEGTTGIPDGTVIDDNLAQWHSDNTEIQHTKSRPSLGGNICLGVWEQTGPRSFRLNHFPQVYDATGTDYIGTIQLQEEITVSPDGKTYKGTFTLDQYDTTGQPVAHGHVQGKVKATRITVKSSIADIL